MRSRTNQCSCSCLDAFYGAFIAAVKRANEFFYIRIFGFSFGVGIGIGGYAQFPYQLMGASNFGFFPSFSIRYKYRSVIPTFAPKTVNDFYHFLMNEAEPATNMGEPRRKNISASAIHDTHKVMRCAFNQAKRWEYIAKNPILDATLPEHKESKRVLSDLDDPTINVDNVVFHSLRHTSAGVKLKLPKVI